MTNEEIIEALRNNPENKTAYMNELYNQNKGLIYKIALKHTEKADIEDLMQEAYLFLDEAVNNYEGKYGTKFSTYFSYMLSWRFSAYVFCSTSPVKIPRRFNDLIKKYKVFTQRFYQIHGHEPKKIECMRALALSEKELEGLITAINALEVSSIDKPAPFDESLTLADIIASDENIAEKFEEASENEYRKKQLYKALSKLKENERIVIHRNSLKGDSLEQIATDMNTSASYCSSLKNQAIRKLRKDSDLIKAVTNYSSYSDYHYSVTRFKNTRISAVEFAVMRNEEAIDDLYQRYMIYNQIVKYKNNIA